MRSKWLLTYWIQLVLVAMCWAPAHAALPQVTPKPAPIAEKKQQTKAITPEAIEQKIAELDQKIKTFQETETEQTAQQLGVDRALLQKRTKLLKDLRETYEWWLANLRKKANLEKEKIALAKKLAILKERGVKEPPPYSLSFYDDLLSQQQFFAQRQEGYALNISLYSEHLNFLREKREDAGKRWRFLKDKLEATTLPQVQNRLRFETEVAGLEKELAETEYLSAETYRHIFEVLQGMASQQAEVYRSQATWAQKHLRIQDSDLDQQLTLLGQKEKELVGKQAKIQRALQNMAKKWDKLDKELPASSPARKEISQEKRNWQHTQQSMSHILVEHLNILRFQENLWKKRIALLKGEASQEQLVKWQAVFAKNEETGKKYFEYLGAQNVVLQGQLAVLEKRLAEPRLDPRIRDILNSEKEFYTVLIQEQNAFIKTLIDTSQLLQRVSYETKAKLTLDPWSSFKARVGVFLEHFLNFEIWVIDKQAVTVRRFLQALAFLIIGILLTRIILLHLLYPLLEKTLWRHTKTEILQKTVSYLAYTVVFLITLGKLRIPLQSFATLGGGIAIGIGFAAQTIIKNFISGFILLGEKPINIGDLVEVGGILGNVKDIGSRSTLLRTGENKDILVPNSNFLENTITNWTRKDRRIRGQVTVGVAYGSPVDQVKELLLQAAGACDQVLKNPQPFVLFNEFGDNALIFDIYFWIEVAGVMGRRIIQSTLRFKIDELFRAADIIIAFPQRDVHLDTQGPVEVRLVDKKS
jgi:potassium-dependent mechanosensitive channel